MTPVPWTRREFVLPWPPTGLSPNTRQHWSKHHRSKKRYHRACMFAVLEQESGTRRTAQRRVPPPDGELVVRLHFRPPDRRSYDRDNLIARMKAGIDGVCEALAIDDKRFGFPEGSMGPQLKGGAVVIEIVALTQREAPCNDS